MKIIKKFVYIVVPETVEENARIARIANDDHEGSMAYRMEFNSQYEEFNTDKEFLEFFIPE